MSCKNQISATTSAHSARYRRDQHRASSVMHGRSLTIIIDVHKQWCNLRGMVDKAQMGAPLKNKLLRNLVFEFLKCTSTDQD